MYSSITFYSIFFLKHLSHARSAASYLIFLTSYFQTGSETARRRLGALIFDQHPLENNELSRLHTTLNFHDLNLQLLTAVREPGMALPFTAPLAVRFDMLVAARNVLSVTSAPSPSIAYPLVLVLDCLSHVYRLRQVCIGSQRCVMRCA